MSDCQHWYTLRSEDEDKTLYCKDCSVILEEVPYWAGTLKIGMMTAIFPDDIESATLDVGQVISNHLGTNVTLTSVVFTASQYCSVERYMVGFTIGGKQMIADLSDVRRATKRVPTNRLYVEPVVEETAEPAS